MTLLIFAAFFAVLGIVCILIPFHIGMTGICLLLLAAVLAALWLGLSGLLLYVGMQSGSIPLMFCGGLVLACGGILLADKIRRVRRR